MTKPRGDPVEMVSEGPTSLMNASIRDAVPLNSTVQRTQGFMSKMFLIRNTLDQTITVVAYGAEDAAMTIPYQLASNVLGVGSVAATWRVDEMTQPWPYVRYTVTAGGIPTVGAVTIKFFAQ
jgi:hypothetical protein